MVLDPIPQSLPVHFFGSRPQPPTSHQKWVDEQSYLVDATMGMYQVDTSPENVDLEDHEDEERMSTWVNSLTI